MSRWHGKYGQGARRDVRERLRAEAEQRNTHPQDVAGVDAGAPREVCRRIARTRPYFVWHSFANRRGATR